MKNKLTIVLISAFAFASCSKQAIRENGTGAGNITVVSPAQVPVATTTAFSNEFTGASGVEWQRSSSNSFTVQFNFSSQRHSAGYDDNGHRSSHSVICTDGPVPQAVLDSFRTLYPTDQVYEWKLRNDGTWRAHIMRGSVKYEATFSATGTLIKFERSA
ncbi:MAG: hypothetical protein ACO25B_11800 [Chitinophagaceae bacterium]